MPRRFLQVSPDGFAFRRVQSGLCNFASDLKILRVIPAPVEVRLPNGDFPRGGRVPAPWEKILATTGRENQSSPPCRPDAPSGSRQSATEKISRLLSTKPDHSLCPPAP